jgi:tRNA uridine 5-carboxymethylaminomethyl modification enzyme
VHEILSCIHVDWDKLQVMWPDLGDIDAAVREQIEYDALYSGYMERHDADVEAFRKDEALMLPVDLNYAAVGSLSTEVRTKLERARPETLGAASRIPGVTPAAIIALLRHVKRKDKVPDQHAA